MLNVVILNVILMYFVMQNVVILNVIMMYVVILGVMGPGCHTSKAGLLNKSSCFAPTLGVTKNIAIFIVY